MTSRLAARTCLQPFGQDPDLRPGATPCSSTQEKKQRSSCGPYFDWQELNSAKFGEVITFAAQLAQAASGNLVVDRTDILAASRLIQRRRPCAANYPPIDAIESVRTMAAGDFLLDRY
jgi:hypothetical protein